VDDRTTLTTLTAHEMADRLRAGETTSRELAEDHLERARRTDHGLHAWLTLDDDRALAEADAADARLTAARTAGQAAVDALHPLLGIPVALKDLVSLKDGQCTAGSRILEGYRAPYDAHITERLRDAGAVILGKTNMDEFAMGSIRQPASLVGIVGMKPTYGRVSRYGIVAFASSLDQIGPFGRDVRDAAALLHAVSGRDERDSTSAPVPVPDDLVNLPSSDDAAAAHLRGKRFGLPKEYFVAGMEPGVEARIREAVASLEGAGAIVEEVSLPHTDYGLATYYIVAPAECSANLARYDGVRFGHSVRGDQDYLANYLATRGGGFGPEVKRRIMLGTYALSTGYYDAFYVKAQKVRTLIKRDFDVLWEQGFDALVAPTSAQVAWAFGAKMDDPVQMYLSDACTLPVNMAGLPGISIPCGLSDGLPVGLQLIGGAWSEGELCRLSRGYEGATAGADWRSVQPHALAALEDASLPTPAERAAALAGAH